MPSLSLSGEYMLMAKSKVGRGEREVSSVTVLYIETIHRLYTSTTYMLYCFYTLYVYTGDFRILAFNVAAQDSNLVVLIPPMKQLTVT